MDFNNRRHMHAVAADRLENAQSVPRIALTYGGIVVLSSFLATTVNFGLGQLTNQYGGLQNMGTRTILSTIRSMLPILMQLLLMALELGFVSTMLRVSRRQFASAQGLRMGFDRFWPLIKVTVLQSCLYLVAVMGSFYLSMQIFMITPLSNPVMEVLSPLLQSSGALNPMTMLEDPNLTGQLTAAMAPLFVLMGIVMLCACLPLFYHYRLVNYIIIDKPSIPALAALGESWRLMKHNCLGMFKLDLSMWWYYLAMAGCMVLCYGDVILSLFGVSLPMSGTVSYFLTLILYLLGSLAVICVLRPRVEITYALAYDSLRPQDPHDPGGAVLGNIFNM